MPVAQESKIHLCIVMWICRRWSRVLLHPKLGRSTAQGCGENALVRVVEGNMNAMQIRMELERLVPAKVAWEVEEIERNVFKTMFPLKGEMLHMI
jgi:hypothetical protein